MGCKQSFGCCTSQCKINNTFKFSYIIKKKKKKLCWCKIVKTGRCWQLRQRDSVCNNAPVSCFHNCYFSAKILYINLSLMFALRFSEQKKRTLPVKCLDVASHLGEVTRPGVNPARDPKMC